MNKFIIKPTFAGIVLSVILIGCTGPSTKETNSLGSLRALGRGSANESSITGLRYTALRDAALSLGARGGLAFRANQINRELAENSRYLERIFNFNSLMLDNMVLPPVLIEGRDTLDQNCDDVLRLADRQFYILQQARFVTAAPYWRDYLWMNYLPPEVPDRSLLPKDENEKKVWERYVAEGWQAGIDQANTIFAESLGRLKRDYEGMVRYRTLLAQNMVSAPFVARTELGITGGEGEMAVNDRILRITALPAFEMNGERWQPNTTPLNELPEPENAGAWHVHPPGVVVLPKPIKAPGEDCPYE